VAKALLERKVGELVGRMTQTVPTAVSCAGDLAPEVGRQTSCTVTSAAQPMQLTVTTSGVDGGLVRFAIEQR
jgi:hypothetical protein